MSELVTRVSYSSESKSEKKFAVKVNTIVKDVVLHKYPCSQIRKRGGIGIHNQVIWMDFDNFIEARSYVRDWEKKRAQIKNILLLLPQR